MKQQGGCHCGKVRFEAEVSAEKGMSCNCSICGKRGTILTFVPEEGFKLLSGQDALTDYQFGKKSIHHYFCGTCGVSAFGAGATPDGKKMRAINLRCLDGIDLGKIQVQLVNGKDF